MKNKVKRNIPACIAEDELLSEAVIRFPALYDKRIKDYKDRVVNRNAWEEVAKSLEFCENGKKYLVFIFFPR